MKKNIIPEMTAEETLSEVMARYKDQQPKDFGNGITERCYPITAVVDIVGERTTPLQSHITQLEKQNAVYREALKEINEIVCDVRISSQPKVYSVIRIAEQALNHKDNG